MLPIYFSIFQQLETAVFNHNGSEFLTAHADGSYATWSTTDSSRPKDNPVMPYGRFKVFRVSIFVLSC